MDAIYRMFERIIASLEQIDSKIMDIKQDMVTALSSINEALGNLADLPDAVADINTEITGIKNRLNALEDDGGGGTEPPNEP